jgi:hypothetical protein
MSHVNKIRADIPQKVQEELRINFLRVRAPGRAIDLWDRIFTADDRRRLGGNLQSVFDEYGTAGMWAKLRGTSDERAIVDVALELGFIDDRKHRWLLRELGEFDEDAEMAVQNAVATANLVLVERPRTAYWNQEIIDVAWERRDTLWVFLLELARAAKSGQVVDRLVFGQRTRINYMTQQKSRLLSLPGFPESLGQCIQPKGRGTQQLQIAPHSIRIFEWIAKESVREWVP